MSDQEIKDKPRPKTKKELLELLEDSERRNKAFKATLEATETQLTKYKPKGQSYHLSIKAGEWRYLSWENTREIAQKLLEAGAAFDIQFEARN